MARVYVERRELPDDLRHLLTADGAGAEYTPPIDVVETDASIQILLDVPGVEAGQIDVVFSRNVLLITGEKTPVSADHADAAFHIAERAFGRFARAIALEGAFDAGKAVATLTHGELRVILPRVEERRGTRIKIPVL
ncbi:MAG TPA: Hsp20/alpha crystallin family protein [Vicinamibacterales bacterium]|jgi:HSP20 family protein